MTITDLAPEALHVTLRGNALVVPGGHIEDLTDAEVAWFQTEMQRRLASIPSVGHITVEYDPTYSPDGGPAMPSSPGAPTSGRMPAHPEENRTRSARGPKPAAVPS